MIERRIPDWIGGLILALGVSTGAQASGIPDFDAHHAEVNGTRLFYQSAGAGDAVMLVHGYTQTGDAWAPLARALTDTHRVIVPDLRGLGRSAPATEGFDKKTAAADLHALAGHLGLGRVALVGHDIGLMVVYAYAAQWPETVDRLVAMDAPLPGIPPWESLQGNPALWHFHFHGPTAEALVVGRERIYFDHFWNDFAMNPAAIPEAERQRYTAAYAAPGRMRAGFGYFAAFPRDAADNAGFARQPLPMPVLAMGGEHSAGELVAGQFRQVADSVEAVVITDSGHWLLEEQPAAVVARIGEFLR